MKSLYLDGYVHLFSGREEYLHSYTMTALCAKSAIDICTCYVFHTNAATKYVLLDLLPYIARRNGVKVRVLFEAMTLESQILHSAFNNGTAVNPPEQNAFIHSFPEGSPPFDRAIQTYHGASDLVRNFMDITSSLDIEVKFWMARDKRMRYRVKNHTKCDIFDGETVIAGGSNLIPRGGLHDTDLLMRGDVAGMYQLDIDRMWNAMSVGSDLLEEEKKDDCGKILASELEDDLDIPKDNTGLDSKIFFLASQPSSIGEDVILRCVIGDINSAKQSISICMGQTRSESVCTGQFALLLLSSRWTT
jgi:phosphatidylserine/phosphatidylglycerophosphate/cardiolipin synthase-like enzyme